MPCFKAVASSGVPKEILCGLGSLEASALIAGFQAADAVMSPGNGAMLRRLHHETAAGLGRTLRTFDPVTVSAPIIGL